MGLLRVFNPFKGTIVSTDVFYGIVYKKCSKPGLNLEIHYVVQVPEKT